MTATPESPAVRAVTKAGTRNGASSDTKRFARTRIDGISAARTSGESCSTSRGAMHQVLEPDRNINGRGDPHHETPVSFLRRSGEVSVALLAAKAPTKGDDLGFERDARGALPIALFLRCRKEDVAAFGRVDPEDASGGR